MTTSIQPMDDFTRSTSPTLILGYETERASQNKIHDLIGGGIAVTLVKPRPRSGTLNLFYLTEADALDCVDIHSGETFFVLYDSDRPFVGMAYVVSGAVSLQLDDQSRNRWVVTVGYQEVDV